MNYDYLKKIISYYNIINNINIDPYEVYNINIIIYDDYEKDYITYYNINYINNTICILLTCKKMDIELKIDNGEKILISIIRI